MTPGRSFFLPVAKAIAKGCHPQKDLDTFAPPGVGGDCFNVEWVWRNTWVPAEMKRTYFCRLKACQIVDGGQFTAGERRHRTAAPPASRP